jgi:hypothetical protein
MRWIVASTHQTTGVVGWGGDPVEVTVDGKRAYEGRPTIRMQTGYAASVDVDVSDGADRCPSRSGFPSAPSSPATR